MLPLSAPAAGAGCEVTPRPGRPVLLASRIRLVAAESLSPTQLEAAIDLWRACPGYGLSFPSFVTEGEADFELRVEVESRIDGQGRCAHVERARIVLYAWARDTTGFRIDCAGKPEVLAHELGHVLELDDTGLDRSCDDHLMAPLKAGQLARGSTARRRAQPVECDVAARRWRTWEEIVDLETRADGTYSR